MIERLELALGRIKEIEKETILEEKYQNYFKQMAAFLLQMAETYEFVKSGEIYQADLETLKKQNEQHYEEILPAHYETSYANPEYSCTLFGKEYGQLLSFVYAELRSLIPYVYEQNLEAVLIRMELFLELYGAFVCAKEEQGLPAGEELRQMIYWFVSDYTEEATQEKIRKMVTPSQENALKIVMESSLDDLRYLYYYGEYVTENEYKTAEHLSKLPAETIQLMADTYTEGYRIGFEVGNKDITKKKTVNVRFCLGFEKMIRQAILNFEKIGLEPTIYRAPASILQGKSVYRVGYCGAVPNKQYDYDHKDDQALILDKALIQRRMESLQNAYEMYKEAAGTFGGPAVLETFGEIPSSPKNKEEALHLTDKQQKMLVEYAAAAGELQNRYIKGEERSFTIIAFPTPQIGENFGEIFNEIIRINTLDYKLYQGIQQTIIDTLDKGEYALIKGKGKNKTNLKVNLIKLSDKDKQTKFENCVADVNIPVGEVFTSPVLAGTEGTLHVTKVFLNEMEYKDLTLEFKDGRISNYSCKNFETEAENRKFIKDNVLYHHDTLPMGEFAIGTNTTAYMVSKKYDIADKLPILIAEKMGPHFAVGDTCYSHAEEVAVFNPDGKEIIARDNEVSLGRKENKPEAYLNCHTDITIPYEELAEISVVTENNEVITIIEDGRFVLQGCEELNKPFD